MLLSILLRDLSGLGILGMSKVPSRALQCFDREENQWACWEHHVCWQVFCAWSNISCYQKDSHVWESGRKASMTVTNFFAEMTGVMRDTVHISVCQIWHRRWSSFKLPTFRTREACPFGLLPCTFRMSVRRKSSVGYARLDRIRRSSQSPERLSLHLSTSSLVLHPRVPTRHEQFRLLNDTQASGLGHHGCWSSQNWGIGSLKRDQQWDGSPWSGFYTSVWAS